jgi:hypothetical protein
MIYSPVLLVHIFGGVGGVLSGSTALVARKGSPLHRKSGDIFVVCMLLMAAAGAYVALIHSQPANVMGGVFTFYLVATAWLTVQRRPNETGRLEYGLLLLGLAAGASSFFLAWQAAHGPTGLKTGEAIPYMVFGAAGLLAGAGYPHGDSRWSRRLETSDTPFVADEHCALYRRGIFLPGRGHRSGAPELWTASETIYGSGSPHAPPRRAGAHDCLPDNFLAVPSLAQQSLQNFWS